MRILLVEPDDRGTSGVNMGGLFVMEPLSLELIAAAVPEDEVLIVDLRLDPNPLEYYLQTFKPDVVGVTGITALHNEMNRILREAKAFGAFTVAGGPHASFAYQDLEADAVVIGEGEGTFRRLVATLAGKGRIDLVPNLAWRQGKKYLVNRLQLYKLWPLPKRCFAMEYKYTALGHEVAMLEATRGCPHRCSFCVTPKLFHGRYRVREVSEVTGYIATRSEEMIMFPDANFMASPRYVASFIEEVRRAKIEKKYSVAVRADDVVEHSELIREWSDLGLCFAFIGYEGYKQEQLNSYGKKTSLDTNERCVAVLDSCNVISLGTLIVQPDWGQSEFDECLAYVKALGSDMTLFMVLTPYPGAPMSQGYEATAPYNKFDSLHAVTETVLSYREFQRNFAQLSRAVWFTKATLRLLRKLVSRGFFRMNSLAALTRFFKYVRRYQETIQD